MNIDELIKNKFVERAFIMTPCGGDYSEAHFFDKDWSYTTKLNAEHIVIKEYRKDGMLLNETFMNRKTPSNHSKMI